MAKLSFRYSAMKSGKSAEIIQIHTNYKIMKIEGLLLIPEKDDASDGKIKSRFGETQAPATSFNESTNFLELVYDEIINRKIKYVIIDECNFLTRLQVNQLAELVDNYDINILTYGLMTNFKGELFEGSKRLVEVADKIESIYVRSRCICGKTALFNARFVNGEFCYEGKEVVIDKGKIGKTSEVEYVPLCRKCFMEKKEEIFKDRIIDVKYITYWEGGCELETNAKVDVLTGEVVEIESVDVDDEYGICESEFVKYQDGAMEQVILTNNGKYFIISKLFKIR